MNQFEEGVVLAFKRDIDQQGAAIQNYLGSAQVTQDQKDPAVAKDIQLMQQEEQDIQQLSQTLNQRIQNFLKLQPA